MKKLHKLIPRKKSIFKNSLGRRRTKYEYCILTNFCCQSIFFFLFFGATIHTPQELEFVLGKGPKKS